jgi:hypothetical protein
MELSLQALALTLIFVYVKAMVDTSEDQLQDYGSRRAAFRVIQAWLLAPDAQRLRSEKREHTRSRSFMDRNQDILGEPSGLIPPVKYLPTYLLPMGKILNVSLCIHS